MYEFKFVFQTPSPCATVYTPKDIFSYISITPWITVPLAILATSTSPVPLTCSLALRIPQITHLPGSLLQQTPVEGIPLLYPSLFGHLNTYLDTPLPPQSSTALPNKVRRLLSLSCPCDSVSWEKDVINLPFLWNFASVESAFGSAFLIQPFDCLADLCCFFAYLSLDFLFCLAWEHVKEHRSHTSLYMFCMKWYICNNLLPQESNQILSLLDSGDKQGMVAVIFLYMQTLELMTGMKVERKYFDCGFMTLWWHYFLIRVRTWQHNSVIMW